MWLLEELQNHGSSPGMQGASPSAAFTELEHALEQRKDSDDVLTGALSAAITRAASCAWPPKLLQGTLDQLFKGVEDFLGTGNAEAAELEDCDMDQDEHGSRDQSPDRVKLCISLFCHVLRSQISWAEHFNGPRAGKEGSSSMTAVQWLSIKETGARRLCSLEEAFRLDKIPMDAYDRAAAHKLIQLTAVELGLDATSKTAQAFGASKALKQHLVDILAGPFTAPQEHGESGAAEHLQLLLSFCHAKQHASRAADLLISIMAHLYMSHSPPVACVSMAAHLAFSAGAHQQDVERCSKEAAQQSSAKLNMALTILAGFCAVDAHAAWLTFALLAKDLPGYMANTQPGIRKLSLDLAAAALKPKAGRPPEQVLAAATQLILSGMVDKDALVRAKATQHLTEAFPAVLGSGYQLQPLLEKLRARLLDKSSSVRRKAVHLVNLICEALASQDSTYSRTGETELLSALFKPLSLLVCPLQNSALVTAEEERKEARKAMLALADRLSGGGPAALAIVSHAREAGIGPLPLLREAQAAGLVLDQAEFRALLDEPSLHGEQEAQQVATFAQLLSQEDARSVLQHAFLGIYNFCEGAKAEQARPDALTAYGRLNSDLRAAWAVGGLSSYASDAPAETAILLHLLSLLRSSQEESNSARIAEGFKEGAQAVSCAELALKCLAAGLRGESSSQAECSGLTTEWINRQYSPQYSRDSALLASKAWAELLKVSFHAPEGASTAMQLFMGQATRLSHALQDGALSPAQLCSFFTVLGAMPQCLKAEADAILAMLRSARETDQQQGGEADPDTDAGSAVDGRFNYMQKAETIRMNDAAATSCMEKLLADFAPCQLMPLLLRAAAESHTPEIQVAALRAATEYAVLSEGIGTELCSVMAMILGSHSEHSPSSAALPVTLEALRTGEKLLESYAGMQEEVLGTVGSLACCAGAPCQIQEAAALTFGRLFLMPSMRATSSLCHVGAGVCAENAKVKAVMGHLLRAAASAHAQPWSVLMSAFTSTPLPLRRKLAQVLLEDFFSPEDLCHEKLTRAALQAHMLAPCCESQEAALTLLNRMQPSYLLLKTLEEHLQDSTRGLTQQACSSLLSFVQNAKQTGRSAEAKSVKRLQQNISALLLEHGCS